MLATLQPPPSLQTLQDLAEGLGGGSSECDLVAAGVPYSGSQIWGCVGQQAMRKPSETLRSEVDPGILHQTTTCLKNPPKK